MRIMMLLWSFISLRGSLIPILFDTNSNYNNDYNNINVQRKVPSLMVRRSSLYFDKARPMSRKVYGDTVHSAYIISLSMRNSEYNL